MSSWYWVRAEIEDFGFKGQLLQASSKEEAKEVFLSKFPYDTYYENMHCKDVVKKSDVKFYRKISDKI